MNVQVNKLSSGFKSHLDDNIAVVSFEKSIGLKGTYKQKIIKRILTISNFKNALYFPFYHINIEFIDPNELILDIELELCCNFENDKNDYLGMQYLKLNSIKLPVKIIKSKKVIYKIDENKFYNIKYCEIEIRSILNRMLCKQIRPFNLVSGFPVRIFNLNVLAISSLFSIIKYPPKFMLFLFYGIKFDFISTFDDLIKQKIKQKHKPNDTFDDLIKSNNKTKGEPENSTTFTILGYTGNPWAIVSFCLINLIIYSMFSLIFEAPIILKNIIKYNSLSVMYIIVSLTLYEKLGPKVLESLQRTLVKISNYFRIKLYKPKYY